MQSNDDNISNDKTCVKNAHGKRPRDSERSLIEILQETFRSPRHPNGINETILHAAIALAPDRSCKRSKAWWEHYKITPSARSRVRGYADLIISHGLLGKCEGALTAPPPVNHPKPVGPAPTFEGVPCTWRFDMGCWQTHTGAEWANVKSAHVRANKKARRDEDLICSLIWQAEVKQWGWDRTAKRWGDAFRRWRTRARASAILEMQKKRRKATRWAREAWQECGDRPYFTFTGVPHPITGVDNGTVVKHRDAKGFKERARFEAAEAAAEALGLPGVPWHFGHACTWHFGKHCWRTCTGAILVPKPGAPGG